MILFTRGSHSMKVYDFDETMFTGDSEDRFFDYIFHQKGFFWYHINWWWWEILLRLKIINKTTARQGHYKFLRKIKNLDEVLEGYWDSVMKYMKPWYMAVKDPEDIVASGTPAFLMEPAMRRLGLKHLVATDMDKHTGKIVSGMFAIGPYKLDNFKKQFSTDVIDEFYSDAWSDRFLAECAKKAYVVHDDDQLTEWNEYFNAHPEKKK